MNTSDNDFTTPVPESMRGRILALDVLQTAEFPRRDLESVRATVGKINAAGEMRFATSVKYSPDTIVVTRTK